MAPAAPATRGRRKSRPDTPATQPDASRGDPPKRPPIGTATAGSSWWFDPEDFDEPEDWAKGKLPEAAVNGIDNENALRTFCECQHSLNFGPLFEWAKRTREYVVERTADLAERRLDLRRQRDGIPTTLKDPSGAKELTLWSVTKISLLIGATATALSAGLGYSYRLARNAGIAEQPADAVMLAVCLLGVAGFLHAINYCLPKQVLRDWFLGAQSVVGIVAALSFWLMLADGASGAVEAGDFYATASVVAEPEDTPSALSGIAFCVLEACSTSVFLSFVLRAIDGLNPKTIQNPVLAVIDQQLDELAEAEDAMAIELSRADALCKSEDAHRHACVELLVANWRAKREVRAYKLSEAT